MKIGPVEFNLPGEGLPIRISRSKSGRTATERVALKVNIYSKIPDELVERGFWGIHSPEIIESQFDPLLKPYLKMFALHYDMVRANRDHPEVYFNEHGEITNVKYGSNERGEEVTYWFGKPITELYKDFGFFFEGEKY